MNVAKIKMIRLSCHLLLITTFYFFRSDLMIGQLRPYGLRFSRDTT